MSLKVNERGLVLIGCGRMGGALLDGWLDSGIEPSSVHVIDPYPRPELRDLGVTVGETLPHNPAVIVIAVKPQSLESIADNLPAIGKDTLVLSVVAGITLLSWEALFPHSPIVRAMPNTPAMIRQGVTAIIANGKARRQEMDLATEVMKAVGHVVELNEEAQIDAVTALSGSGPAYVFHMIEAMAAAGQAEGLPLEMALDLAKKTVAGAGMLAMQNKESLSDLRHNVTSPNGTTAAGLDQLMSPEQGLSSLISRTISAAAKRSRELASGQA